MKKYLHILILAFISLLIVFPFFNDKYILTLDTLISPTAIHGVKSFSDFIFGIYLNRPNQGELGLDASRIPLLSLSVMLKSFISTSILQKIEIFLIFFLSMLSMHTLLKNFSPPIRYFASFLYAI